MLLPRRVGEVRGQSQEAKDKGHPQTRVSPQWARLGFMVLRQGYS